MLYGVCGGLEVAPVAKAAGYDFLESGVNGILKPREPRAEFEAVLEELQQCPLPLPVLNAFVPGDLRITGATVDAGRLEAHAATVFERAREAGVEHIVFGSGAARKADEGWDHDRAREQIVIFLKQIAPLAAANGVTVVIEPLRKEECNVINSTAQGAAIARAVGEPSIRLLVDGYHWACENDTVEAIVANGDLLTHAHLATLPNRAAPGVEPYDFAPFFGALADAGYKGRISIEGRFDRTPEVLRKALEVMRAAAG